MLLAIVSLASFVPAVSAAQQAKRFEAKISVLARLDYLLYLPGDYQSSKQEFPLLLFLHGAGETGTDLAMVKKHGPPKIAEATNDFPFILVSPQSPSRGWNPDTLAALLDHVTLEYRVDKKRVYLTGLSMGGYGTWALAAAHPEKFAAIAPICGGGNIADAPKLARLPIWAFHGAKDPVVPLQRSKEMVEAIKAAGGDVKFTVYPEALHDSWTETYSNPELYSWFLRHQKQ